MVLLIPAGHVQDFIAKVIAPHTSQMALQTDQSNVYSASFACLHGPFVFSFLVESLVTGSPVVYVAVCIFLIDTWEFFIYTRC